MSRTSSVTWELIIIAGILLILPLSMVFAGGVFSEDEESDSYFSPEEMEDFGDGSMSMRSIRLNTRPMAFIYHNDTGDTRSVGESNLYTRDFTGNDHHEYLFAEDSSDDGSFESFYSVSIGLNQTVEDAVNEDLNEVSFTAEFPRNTSLDMAVWSRGEDSDGDDVNYELNSKTIDVNTNMTEYSIEIDYSKLLDAHSQQDTYERLSIRLRPVDDEEYDVEPIQPGDSLKFNIDLMSSYTASPLITTNFFAGIMGGLSLMAGIFTSPWVDFKDVAGPIIGVIR